MVDVSLSSLWRVHGEGRREQAVEQEAQEEAQERRDVDCVYVCVCVTRLTVR